MKIIKCFSLVLAVMMACACGTVDAALKDNFSITVNVSGVNKTLVLSRHSVRASDILITTWDSTNGYVNVHDETGVLAPAAFEVRTYRGYVSQTPNELVTAVVLANNELRAEGHCGKGELWTISGISAGGVAVASVAPAVSSNPTKVLAKIISSIESSVFTGVLPPQDYMPPSGGIYRADAVFDIPSQFFNKSSYGNGNVETTIAVFEDQLNRHDLFNVRDAQINMVMSQMIIRKEQFYFPTAGTGEFTPMLRNEWDDVAANTGRANARGFIASLFPYNFTYAGGYATGNDFYAANEPICVNSFYHENAHNWRASHYYYGRDTMNGSHRHHGELNVQRVLYTRDIQIGQGDLLEVTGYPTNLHPYATLDMATTLIDTAVDIPVLNNDWDCNGDAISVRSYTTTTVQGGTVTSVGDTLTYTPAAGYVGKDIIVYEVEDAPGLYTVGLVHVEVINRGLAAYWAFEEATGSLAVDSSGNGHNGTLVSNTFDAGSVPGVIGNAVVVMGNKGMICDATDIIAEPEVAYPLESRASNFFDPMDEDYSVAFWFMASDLSSTVTLVDKGNKASFGYSITANEGTVTAKIREWDGLNSSVSVSGTGAYAGTWCHVAMVIGRSTNTLKIYVSGVAGSTASLVDGSFIFEGRTNMIMGTDQWNGGPAVEIAFDELMVYTKPLSLSDITGLMSGAQLPAGAPSPSNGEMDVEPGKELTWQAGKPSYEHDVYFGTSFDAVAGATTASDEYKGRLADAAYQPVNMIPQMNYFWRVDEVDGGNIILGDVWAFSTARSFIEGGLKLHATLDTADIIGTTVDNVTGNSAYDGQIVGTLGNPAGKIEQALDFPKSTSDYVDFGQGLDPGLGSFTVSVWFKLDTLGSTQYIIDKGNNSNSTEPGFSIWVRSDGLIEYRGNHVGSASSTKFSRHMPAGTIVTGQWYHAVMVLSRSKGTIKAFLNGSSVPSSYEGNTLTAGLPISSTEPLVIGVRPGAYPADGLIDDVAVWKRALKKDEVLDIYNKGLAGETFHEPAVAVASTSFEASEGFVGSGEIFLLNTVVDPNGVEWYSGNGAKIWNRSDIPPDGTQCLVLGLSNTDETAKITIPGSSHGVGVVTFEYASYSDSTDALFSLMYNANDGVGWQTAWSTQVVGSNPDWSDKPWPSIAVPINVSGDVDLRFKKNGVKGVLIDKVTVTDRVTNPPVFDAETYNGLDSLEGYDYSDSVAGTASDLDEWDVLSYSHAGGPDWLTVAANGDLTGKPGNDDVGLNQFTIRATGLDGLSDEVTLNITVLNTFTGELGLGDLLEMAGHWLDSGCVDVPACGGTDLNGDGYVDIEDFAALADKWL